MNSGSESSGLGGAAAGLAVVVVTAVLVTVVVESTDAALVIAVLAMYVLHLVSLRRIREHDAARRDELRDFVEDAVRRQTSSSGRGRAKKAAGTSGGPGGTRVYTPPSQEESGRAPTGDEDAEALWQEEAPDRDVPVPRNFALGTVALIRKEMTPREIDEVLKEQESRPGEYFGQIAVELGYLTPDELDDLLEVQKEGLFTVGEIQDARRRLKAYQRRVKSD